MEARYLALHSHNCPPNRGNSKVQKQETRNAEENTHVTLITLALVLTGFRRSDLHTHPVVSISEYPRVVPRHSPDLPVDPNAR